MLRQLTLKTRWARSPEVLLAAGTTGAATLEEMLHVNGLEGLRVREMMEPGMMQADAVTVKRSARLAGGREGSVDELMRISVNLATRPFVELRPLFARLRLAMGVLAVLAIGLGFGLHSLNGQARAAQVKMDALKAKTRGFETGTAGE